ncbi:MAG: helix-turn-helix domain-containing protein [Acholeplasma sp.]|nr:helix-turn-helix domain-containing protein [Acholeplasma sp.]
MIDYADKIKEYRERNFLTQDEFAKILGVSKTSITRWETGKFSPSIKIKKVLYTIFIKSGMKLD